MERHILRAGLMFLLIWGVQCGMMAQEVLGVYRYIGGQTDGLKICIVDGALVREKIYHEFVYGGNSQRYLFNPAGEIWIDNAISAEEYRYTLRHEINEYHLMSVLGWTYADAHDSSLRLEQKMRNDDFISSRQRENTISCVSPRDCDGLKQIPTLPDSIRLENIYLQKYETVDSLIVWIVDGSRVRRCIYPDFGFSGSDAVYKFIPPREIWIDAQISCEETGFSIQLELAEREMMLSGMDYDSAYELALAKVTALRQSARKQALSMPAVQVPIIKDRDKGTGKND